MSNVATVNQMKPYMLIEGSNQSIEAFEQKVTKALEMGYTLAGELVTSLGGTSEVKFFQPVMFMDEDEEDEEDEEYEDDDYEEDEE